MSLESLLVQTCEIHRWSPRSVGSDRTLDGGRYTLLTSGVRCNVQEKSARIKKTIGGQIVEFSAVGYFEPETDLRAAPQDGQHEDLVVLSDGSRFFVKGVTDQTGRGFMHTVYLDKKDGPSQLTTTTTTTTTTSTTTTSTTTA